MLKIKSRLKLGALSVFSGRIALFLVVSVVFRWFGWFWVAFGWFWGFWMDLVGFLTLCVFLLSRRVCLVLFVFEWYVEQSTTHWSDRFHLPAIIQNKHNLRIKSRFDHVLSRSRPYVTWIIATWFKSGLHNQISDHKFHSIFVFSPTLSISGILQIPTSNDGVKRREREVIWLLARAWRSTTLSKSPVFSYPFCVARLICHTVKTSYQRHKLVKINSGIIWLVNQLVATWLLDEWVA